MKKKDGIKMASEIRVRYAPSPTGHLHIGGARSALFNYLFAKRNNGKFIIRIEDTDQARNKEDAEAKQLSSLKWLGVEWDESVDVGGDYGPYRSMERLDTYQIYIDQLLEAGKAYPCYCTPEEIEQERNEAIEKGDTYKYSRRCKLLTSEQKEQYEKEGRKASIRFNVPEGEVITIQDLVRGEVTFETDGIGDFVIVRPDGVPTYNFAVTIDDHLMKISHVIRGEEHLSNTPRQAVIYQALSWEVPQFAHVSLILNQDRQKMSKRDESIIQFVEQYKELGFLPEAIVNFIALLGWSPEGEQEIFSLEEIIEQFSLERVSKSPAVFDVPKLFWMNNHYIKNAPLEKVVDLCLPHLQEANLVSKTLDTKEREWAVRLIALYQEQLSYGKEIVELSEVIFAEELNFGEEEKEILAKEHIPVVMEEFAKQLDEIEEYTPESIKAALKMVQKNTGYKGKDLFMPARIAATGTVHGRDLAETLYLLGKDKVLGRVQQLLTNKN